MRKFVLLTTTWPPLEVTFIRLTFPPNSHVHNACVSSWPKTYIHIGLGSRKKTTHQQATPARKGIHVVSALPVARRTFNKASAAPAQTGRRQTAMMNLIHFGTRED